MIDVARFIIWLCKMFEKNGFAAYNNEQLEEITEFVSKNVRSEKVLVQLQTNIKFRFRDRPLVSEIREVWTDIDLEDVSAPKMLSSGSAMQIYNRIYDIREKMSKGYRPTTNEIDMMAIYSRLETTMCDLLEDGQADKAEEVGNYIKNKIDAGYKIPVVDILKPKNIMQYLEVAINSNNKKLAEAGGI